MPFLTGTLVAQSSWATGKLLEAAAAGCGVPLARLSLAKPPTVGSKALTPKLLAALKWDDPKVLACAKVGSFPLQLRDGDTILLRDAETVPAASGGAPAAAAAGAKGGGCKGGASKPWQNAGVVGGGAREAGLSITTCYDEPPSAASAKTVD